MLLNTAHCADIENQPQTQRPSPDAYFKTLYPSYNPSVQPTLRPTTNKPTPKPTIRPTTAKPTPRPTIKPTLNPSMKPTFNPSKVPTPSPTNVVETDVEIEVWDEIYEWDSGRVSQVCASNQNSQKLYFFGTFFLKTNFVFVFFNILVFV